MLKIVKFKGCKRCKGDLFLESDVNGVYVSCLQCGASYILHEKEEGSAAPKVPVC